MASFVMIWVWVQSRFAQGQATRDEEDLGGVSVGGLDGIQVGRGQGGRRANKRSGGLRLGWGGVGVTMSSVDESSVSSEGEKQNNVVAGREFSESAVEDSYQTWLDFWRAMKRSKHIADPMYLENEYFKDASQRFFFYKLGQNPTEHLPSSLAKVCNNLPFLKRKFKAKWQQRYGILLPNGLLVYFLNDQPKSIALGCICLSGIKIDEDNVQDSANNLVYLSLTSRHPRRPKKKVFQWKVGAQTEDECALLKERILKHQ